MATQLTPEEMRFEAAELHVGGLRKSEIATRLGVTRQTVYNWLKREDVKRHIFDSVAVRCSRGLGKAVDMLDGIIDDEAQKAADRIKAAQVKLDIWERLGRLGQPVQPMAIDGEQQQDESWKTDPWAYLRGKERTQ